MAWNRVVMELDVGCQSARCGPLSLGPTGSGPGDLAGSVDEASGARRAFLWPG